MRGTAAKLILIASLVGWRALSAEAHQVGIASWYGPRFHGRRAASGELYDQHQLTAAHRKLPFGTRVKVTNLRNGRTVLVRINDRGPYVKGRILDLSHAAALVLGIREVGLARISIEVTSNP